jgi:hypothetical protein
MSPDPAAVACTVTRCPRRLTVTPATRPSCDRSRPIAIRNTPASTWTTRWCSGVSAANVGWLGFGALLRW